MHVQSLMPSCAKMNNYLVMKSNYTEESKVKIQMKDYIRNIISEFKMEPIN